MEKDPSEIYGMEQRNVVELLLFHINTDARSILEKELAKAWRAGFAAGTAEAHKKVSEEGETEIEDDGGL